MVESVWQEVVKDMYKREEQGFKSYNKYVTLNDGRDSLLDLYEELLDACVYIKKLMMEKNNGNGTNGP